MGEERGRGPLLHGGRGAETPQPMAEASSLGDPPSTGGSGMLGGLRVQKKPGCGGSSKSQTYRHPRNVF